MDPNWPIRIASTTLCFTMRSIRTAEGRPTTNCLGCKHCRSTAAASCFLLVAYLGVLEDALVCCFAYVYNARAVHVTSHDRSRGASHPCLSRSKKNVVTLFRAADMSLQVAAGTYQHNFSHHERGVISEFHEFLFAWNLYRAAGPADGSHHRGLCLVAAVARRNNSNPFYFPVLSLAITCDALSSYHCRRPDETQCRAPDGYIRDFHRDQRGSPACATAVMRLPSSRECKMRLHAPATPAGYPEIVARLPILVVCCLLIWSCRLPCRKQCPFNCHS